MHHRRFESLISTARQIKGHDRARRAYKLLRSKLRDLVRVDSLLDQPPIEYVVAQARDPQSDTQPFMAFVKSAAAQAAFKSAGLAPIDDAQAAGGGND